MVLRFLKPGTRSSDDINGSGWWEKGRGGGLVFSLMTRPSQQIFATNLIMQARPANGSLNTLESSWTLNLYAVVVMSEDVTF